MNFGNKIKEQRRRAGMTQEQLGDALGVSYQAISKWETNSSLPDIVLLPKIAALFHITIDSLLSDSPVEILDDNCIIRDDDVIRIVQMRGKHILNVNTSFSRENPPIEIAFPRNCNNSTQYFKVEVYGHIICDASINGDVICHQSIECGDINGDVNCTGNIKAGTISTPSAIHCNDIIQCYAIQCESIECNEVNSANLTCERIGNK